jgi:hypothetical protein
MSEVGQSSPRNDLPVEGFPCLDSGKMVVEDVTWTSKVGVSTMMNDQLKSGLIES